MPRARHHHDSRRALRGADRQRGGRGPRFVPAGPRDLEPRAPIHAVPILVAFLAAIAFGLAAAILQGASL